MLGPFDAWHGAAHVGALSTGGGDVREVLVLLGPESIAPDSVDKARRAAGPALDLSHPGVLQLLDVRAFGERIAWVYERADGLGLGNAVGSESDDLLPTRAAAELVARVAEILFELGAEGWSHPGPEPSDLLVDTEAAVRIAGFAGPFPRPPAMRAPQGDEGEDALVYRLGVLLAQLVSGVSPSPPSERDAHAAVIRRALIRAMSRPGPVLTERYSDLLRGMLAWETAERPPLSAVPDGLRKVAEGTAGPDLATWAVEDLPELRDQVEHLAEARRGGEEGTLLARDPVGSAEATADEVARHVAVPPSVTPAPGPRVGPPLQFDGDEALSDDDPTQESAPPSSDPEVADSKPPIRVTSLMPMPVQVGPPAEALRNRPSLPPGFLQDREDTDWDEPVSVLGPWWADPRALWATGGVLLVVIVLLLGINVLLWQRSGADEEPVDERSIADVIDEGDASADASGDPRFPVAFHAPSGAQLQVDCGEQEARGIGTVRLEEAAAGACTVSARLDGAEVTAEVAVAGPATYRCFDNGSERCR